MNTTMRSFLMYEQAQRCVCHLCPREQPKEFASDQALLMHLVNVHHVRRKKNPSIEEVGAP